MKNIKVIYPSDYFNKKEVDEAFKEESECFRNNGFFVTTIDNKNIEQRDYIYRGWMLNEEEYSDLKSPWKIDDFVNGMNYLALKDDVSFPFEIKSSR